MKLTKQFYLGLAAGVLLTIVVAAAAIGLMTWLVFSKIDPEMMAAQSLAAVSVPAEAGRASWGVAPGDWRLTSLEGETTTLAPFGDRTVVVNLWATWCAPCIAEMPGLERLRESLPSEDVAFLAVTQEELDEVRPFVEKRGWEIPVYVAEEIPSVFESPVLPSTFVVAPGGHVVLRHQGAANWDDDGVREFLSELQGDGDRAGFKPAGSLREVSAL